MGALAGRGGRHRSRIAGAAGLIAALAVAAPAPAAAPAQTSGTLVSWERSGGLLGVQDRMRILKDRTIFVAAGKVGTKGRITPAEKERLKLRLRGWRRYAARYEPDVLVADGLTIRVRHKGHGVSVATGAEVPERLDRVLRTLGRLYERYSGE